MMIFKPFTPKTCILFLVTALLLCHFDADAQKRKLRKGDRSFKYFQFDKAIKFYGKAIKKKPGKYESLSKLANVYRILGDYEQGQKWYAEVVRHPEAKPVDYFYYAQMLRSNEKYDSAKIFYLKYAELDSTDPRGQRLAQGIDLIPGLKGDSLNYRVVEFEHNSPYNDFGPALYDSSLVFVSSRGPENRTDVWSDQPFLDLYISQHTDTGFLAPTPLPGNVNKVFHEGPVTFDTTFTTMYFTRNNYIKKRKKRKSEERIMKIKVFKSELEEGKWMEIEELPFTSNEYSVGHPTLTRDGKYMYFASDMPNDKAVGGQDLYVIELTDTGFGKPVNLGKGINTRGDEVFPFIHSDGTLYFASDSYEGLGGLDIYSATKTNGNWGNVQNMRYPINSSKDDFGLVMKDKLEEGFFASNRDGGKGNDDIYRFDDKFTIILAGKVIDKKTREVIFDAKVRLLDLMTNETDSIQSDEDGEFLFKLKTGNEYIATSEKYGYFLISPVRVNTKEAVKDTIKIVLEMQRIDVGEVIKLENIYYDFDKYNIRPDAARELDRFVQFMQEYSDLVVELRSHTDSRGSDNYNMWLSTKRAESAVNYVISKGIDKARINFKGYGESLPVNQCVNDIPCTEEEHQLNRRTEFMVVEQPKGLKVKSSATDR